MANDKILTALLVICLAACAGSPSVRPPFADSSQETTNRESIERHKRLARKLQTTGDLAGAATQWHILTLLAPGDASFGRELDAAKDAMSREVHQNYQSGLSSLRKGDMDDVSQAMFRVLALAPDHSDAAQILRDIERRRIGKIQGDRAARVKRSGGLLVSRRAQATAHQPYDLDPQIEIFMAGDHIGGLREMRRYVDSNPENKVGRQRLSEVVYAHAVKLDGQGTHESAFKYYQQALALHGSAQAHWKARVESLRKRLADEYYNKGLRAHRNDMTMAIRYFETALRYEPKHVNASLKLTEARLYRNKLKQIEKEKSKR